MRELKFRAYLKESDTMLYSENDVHDTLMEVWKIGSGGCKVEVQEEVWREGGGNMYSTVRYVEVDGDVMQFTGLKDKNGKEIYEGDIISFTQALFNTNVDNFPTRTKAVKWQSHTGSWNVYSTNAGEFDIEVIGNIHQNKDLL